MKTDYKSEIRQAIEAGQAKTIERLVVDLVREKINDYRKPDDGPYSHIAHYTSLDAICKMLADYGRVQNSLRNSSMNDEEQSDGRNTSALEKPRECGLRLYDIDSLNDPTEGEMAIVCLEEKYGIEIKSPRSAAYVCSFVAGDNGVGNKLKYWMSYGDHGAGCSIMLPMEDAKKPLKEGFASLVMYDDEASSEACLEEIATIHASLGDEEYRNIFLANALGVARCLFKHRAYRYEQEYRHVVAEGHYPMQWENSGLSIRKFRYEDSLHIRNVMSSSSTITIGPCVPEPEKVKQDLEEIAQALGLVGITFERSGIPRR